MLSRLRPAVFAMARRLLPALSISLTLILIWQVFRGPISAPRTYDAPRRVLESLSNSLSQGANLPEGIQHHDMMQQRVVFFKPGVPFYVHRAFRDDRAEIHVIRIFGIQQKNLISGNLTCSWVREDDVTQEAPGRKYPIATSWSQWSDYFAFNIECRLPRGAAPSAVHLSFRELAIDFEMRVEKILEKHPRQDLAVCVKPITGRMDVAKLVEWFEMQILAGVSNFIMYNSDLTGPAKFVLEHYAARGLATVVSFPFMSAVLRKVEPPAITDHARYAVYQELYLVAYQDCLYRFRESYKYLAFLDLNEVILPSVEEPLPQVVSRVMAQQPDAASLVFFTSWHFQDSKTITELAGEGVPDYLYMAQHPFASPPVDSRGKSVVVTDRALTVGFHEILETIGRHFVNQLVPWKDFAYLHHYQGSCRDVYPATRCQGMLRDSSMDVAATRYTKRLGRRTCEVLDHLQLTRYVLD